jgi:arylsulfatase A-like enzyme
VHKPVHTFLFSLLVLIALFLSSCGGGDGADEGEASTAVDLKALRSIADQETETGDIRLNSSLVPVYFVRGWSEAFPREDGSLGIAAVQKSPLLRINILSVADRWLTFDAGLTGELGDLPGQTVTIKLNNNELTTLRFDEETPARVFLPADLQRQGFNRILFEFDTYLRNRDFEKSTRRVRWRDGYPGVALYLSNVSVRLGDEDGPEEQVIADEEMVIRPVADHTALAQQPDSSISYAFDILPGAVLRVAGSFDPPREGDALSVAIQVRTDVDPAWRDLWRTQVEQAHADSFEEELPLASVAGMPAAIRFAVESSGKGRSGGVIWREMSLDMPVEMTEHDRSRSREPLRMTDRIRHVVVIVTDATRADMMGVTGNTEGLTPNIDEFAAGNIVFTNAIAPAPYTIATVSSIFSGMLPESHGVRDGRDVYPEDLINLGRTFDERDWFTLSLAGTQFVTHKYGITRGMKTEYYLRPEEAKEAGIATMDMELVTRGIREAAGSGDPTFMYIHLLPPHWPYHPPAPYDDRFIDSSGVDKEYLKEIRSFRGDESNPLVQELFLHYKNNMVYADALVGRTLELLRENGMLEDSLIIYTADHGEAFAEHGALEHGNTVYDEMIRVPFIVHVPGAEPAVIEQQVGLIDIFPTLAEMLDLRVDDSAFEGRSIAPLLNGVQQSPARFYYSRAFGDKLKFTLRGEQYKYIYQDGVDLLFDLQQDPHEQNNIAGKLPVLAASMRQRGLLLVATNSAKRAESGDEVELKPEEEEELRNLGYLQ